MVTEAIRGMNNIEFARSNVTVDNRTYVDIATQNDSYNNIVKIGIHFAEHAVFINGSK